MKKYATMIGLVALAALALTAFVGVSGAAAKAKVCSTTGTGAACAAGHGFEYTTQPLEATTTTALGQDATLTSGFINVTCDSTMKGEVTHSGSGKITSLTFTNCTSSLGACSEASSTASAAVPWNSTATASGKNDGNGFMDVSSEVGGHFVCAGVTCKYSAANAGLKNEIAVTGGDATRPKVTATGVPMAKSGGSGFCSATALWHGTYELITPASLWIT